MTEKKYSVELVEKIGEVLEEQGWKADFEEEKGLYRLYFTLSKAGLDVQTIIDVKENEYLVYVTMPFNVDINRRPLMQEVAEYLSRVNYGLKNGNYEMDFGDGDIRYKSYVDCENSFPGDDVIANSILVPLLTVDRYSSGILEIIYANAMAADVYNKLCPDERTA